MRGDASGGFRLLLTCTAAVILFSGCLTGSDDDDEPDPGPITRWHSVGDRVWNSVSSLAVVDSSLYVAGNAPSGARIARWDGDSWHDFADANGHVRHLLSSNGDLIATGGFSSLEGISAAVARWDGKDWTALARPTPGGVFSAFVHQGELHVVGEFSEMNGTATPGGIARWDGAVWHSLPGAPEWPLIEAASFGSQIVAVARVGPLKNPGPHVLISWDGSEWSPWPNLPPTEEGRSGRPGTLLIHLDELYIGYEGPNLQGDFRSSVYRWTGNDWSQVGAEMFRPSGSPAEISRLFSIANHLYVSGEIVRIGSKAAGNIARWDGLNWQTVGSGLNALTIDAMEYRGDLHVGGHFWADGEGNPISHLARWGK